MAVRASAYASVGMIFCHLLVIGNFIQRISRHPHESQCTPGPIQEIIRLSDTRILYKGRYHPIAGIKSSSIQLPQKCHILLSLHGDASSRKLLDKKPDPFESGFCFAALTSE